MESKWCRYIHVIVVCSRQQICVKIYKKIITPGATLFLCAKILYHIHKTDLQCL
jgi:hypothetical protein